jgi:hypothetical protein
MSALGQKQTSEHDRIMSALPLKADIGQHNGDLRFTQSRHQPTWPLLAPA